MGPRWHPTVIAVTLHDGPDRPAIDLEMESQIPSAVRHSFHNQATGRGTPLRNNADGNCAHKSKNQKNLRPSSQWWCAPCQGSIRDSVRGSHCGSTPRGAVFSLSPTSRLRICKNRRPLGQGWRRGNLLSQQFCLRFPTCRSIYGPFGAALFPAWIASCSVMYLPCLVVP